MKGKGRKGDELENQSPEHKPNQIQSRADKEQRTHFLYKLFCFIFIVSFALRFCVLCVLCAYFLPLGVGGVEVMGREGR